MCLFKIKNNESHFVIFYVGLFFLVT